MIAALLLATTMSVTPVPATTPTGAALPMRVVGRAARSEEGWRRQWPGTYFEGAFRGRNALFRVGTGEVALRITIDGGAPVPLVRPEPGLYRITGLEPGAHVVRVAVASESQNGPTVFGGLFAGAGTTPSPLPAAARQIEFVGDSHTVGYGNTATDTTCSTDQVWATTDTTQGIAAVTARHYGADYRVNAISGRGVVRNYDGFAADTLPDAYPFMLFDKARKADDAGWDPQLIVVALGTNDFSTALKPGERWATREALHADYEARYAAFLRRLRAAHPHAHILLWATTLSKGEIAAESNNVVAQLTASGMRDIGFIAVPDLAFSGCHSHPSVADDRTIATAIETYVEAHPGVWGAGAGLPKVRHR